MKNTALQFAKKLADRRKDLLHKKIMMACFVNVELKQLDLLLKQLSSGNTYTLKLTILVLCSVMRNFCVKEL